jgi:polyisoprenoid-binding protein YceI
MKQIIFVLILGLGLVTLSACSLFPSAGSPREANNSVGNNLAAEADVKTPVAPAVLNDGVYQVNLATSQVAWRAAKITATHTGLVSLKSGSLEVSGGALTAATFTFDMTSITSDQQIEPLVKHLKSSDFFDVATYPEAKLIVKSIRPGTAANEYVLTGDLTVKEVTAPLSLMAQIVPSGDGLSAQANFSIDRTKWGIKFLSGNFFKDLGDKAIDDEIDFNVTLKANR